MEVNVSSESRFTRTPDGAVWTHTSFASSFWQRYLAVFDRVHIIARVDDVPCVGEKWKRVDAADIEVVPVPYYIGPWGYVKKAVAIRRALKSQVNYQNAFILRASSQIASVIQPRLVKMGHPYGVEVVGDPFDTFTFAAVKHPLTPFFRWLFTARLRQQCQQASAVAYVTKDYLQRRYPPAPDALSTHYSSIELSKQAFAANPRRFPESRDAYTLVFVGTLAQLYKAPDVLIHAVARCVQKGLDLKLTILGDGRHRAELEALVARLQLGERVSFIGEVPAGAPVRAQLDQADLFVLPSWQEGLPRAVIEAMARGLPCIGSTAGGIPELLPPEAMVPPGDAEMLARKIIEIIRSPERMNEMSERNLHKAREYQDEVLAERRNDFYQYIKNETEAWLNKHPR